MVYGRGFGCGRQYASGTALTSGGSARARGAGKSRHLQPSNSYIIKYYTDVAHPNINAHTFSFSLSYYTLNLDMCKYF
jgi:hypothetical protein